MTPVEPIRRSLTVPIDPERAFALFTEGMNTWWPVDAYSRAVSEFMEEGTRVERLELQAGMGGQILEHTSDGKVLPWAEVITWSPPHRVVLAWRPHSALEPPTVVDVTFSPREGGTLVEVEHRGWERLSEAFRHGLYQTYSRGWNTTLECFAAASR